MTTKIEAAEQLAELDPTAWYDNATHFTCTEAERIADFLGEFVSREVAINFLAYHADDDDEGDRHLPIWEDTEYGTELIGVASWVDGELS